MGLKIKPESLDLNQLAKFYSSNVISVFDSHEAKVVFKGAAQHTVKIDLILLLTGYSYCN